MYKWRPGIFGNFDRVTRNLHRLFEYNFIRISLVLLGFHYDYL